jgi:alpha-ketoglutarate-dependent taurine dioxygenase
MHETLATAVQTAPQATDQTQIQARLHFLNDRKLPAVITADVGESLHSLLTSEREGLAEIRLKYGAILFRGFDLSTPEDFRAAAALAYDDGPRNYVGGVSPRGKVVSGIYESTNFPAHLRIPQHNEMTYLPDPPRHLAFFCEIPPEQGGETPLADSRTIFKLLDAGLRKNLEDRGIQYHRYLYGRRWTKRHRNRHRVAKLHTSWMAAFSTEDPTLVEKICAESGSNVSWDKEEGAKISNTLPAFRAHPETGDMLWSNQVPTFLSSPKATGLGRWLLYQTFFPKPFERPFHATFGDGKPISIREINLVHDAIEKATIRFRWERGDLLLVDNLLITHGRMPYKGPRRILVAIH